LGPGKFDVVIMGEIIVDIIHYLPRLPREEDTWHESVRAEKVAICPGGAGAYCAQALARLGAKCGIMGKVGNDALGQLLIDSLRQEGVNTTGIKIWDKGTPTASILVLRHQRKISLGGGGNWPDLTLSDVNLDSISSYRLFHFGGYYLYPKMWGEPTVMLMKYAKEKGLLTSLDTQMDRTGQYAGELDRVLRHTDILFADEFEAKSVAKEDSAEKAAQKLLSYGPSIIGIKLGMDGCLVATRNETIRIPAFKVEVVDTIGAGDAWDAGFILGELNNWDLRESAEFANATAAFSVMGPGGSEGVSGRREIENFLKQMRWTAQK